ncbi:MAG: GNAT family N-acetyltransferase [Candidatus Cohnella colombiensis]|uniref:GNAT family N-acetyltransferase n=1 Tax=Candidatus Cohnella colombiensis TaxID=3121368 RepID=A0AA95EWG1_9BACL|nr:MAG: GNAT family N-acetyltransferase [Cohnella sp.]
MRAHFRVCQSDADLAQYALFFIRHQKEFNHQFSLANSLIHILRTVQHSHYILVLDDSDQVVGWGHYRFLNAEQQHDPHGELAFLDSTILLPAYRGGRTFLQGFRFLVNQISAQNPHVRTVQFHALADNDYLNRLYHKFAHRIGQSEGYHGVENVYETDFQSLMQYLLTTKSVDNRIDP